MLASFSELIFTQYANIVTADSTIAAPPRTVTALSSSLLLGPTTMTSFLSESSMSKPSSFNFFSKFSLEVYAASSNTF